MQTDIKPPDRIIDSPPGDILATSWQQEPLRRIGNLGDLEPMSSEHLPALGKQSNAHNFINLTGQRFGRLFVTNRFERRRCPSVEWTLYWLCVCDCDGKEIFVRGTKLRSGGGWTRSCGCLKKETVAARNRKEVRDRDNPAYHVWQMMHQRCSNPNSRSYPRHGGKGVRVCERWDNFHSFLADVGHRPSLEHTIDRYPNRKGNYEPTNCRWATRKEQALNTKTVQLITVDGVTDSVRATEQRIGISSGTLGHWLKRTKHSAQAVVDKWRATPTSYRDNRKVLFPHTCRGEKNGRHKLTESDAEFARFLRGNGLTYEKLGKLFRVLSGAIRSITVGKTWSHLLGRAA